MKSLCLICSMAILFCLFMAIICLGIGVLLSLFLPITIFQAALLLMIPFCILLILMPLLLINQKMEQMMVMTDEDYMFWDEEDVLENKVRSEKKRQHTKKNQKKIIVMQNSPIMDQNAPCPCGSGEKYKNCCGKTGKSTKK